MPEPDTTPLPENVADTLLGAYSDTSLSSGLIVGAIGGLVVGVAGLGLALLTDMYYNGFAGVKSTLSSPGTLGMTFMLYFLAGMLGNALNHYFSITYKLGLDQIALQQLGWAPPPPPK